MMHRFGIPLLGLIFCAAAQAESNNNPTTKPASTTKGELELGVISTTGNTETNSIQGKLSITQDLESWKSNYVFDALYKDEKVDDNGVKKTQTSAEKYFASTQFDYKLLNQHSALFLFASYEQDRFSGYDYQTSVAAGYSEHFLRTAPHDLTLSAGPGYSMSKNAADGEKNDTVIIRLAMNYKFTLSENARFQQTLSTEAAVDSEDNSKTKSETSVAAKVMGDLSLKAGYAITHNSEVPDGTENTDTSTTLSVIYVF